MLKEDFLPVGDYVSPGFSIILPDKNFPNLIIGDKKYSTWRYSRREIPHNRYVDKRFPAVGFNNRDEVHILYNTALKFQGKKALEIGCWLGWSACHMALGGVNLDVIDPLLEKDYFYQSVSNSLKAAHVLNKVNLIPGYSPQTVENLARKLDYKWSLIFIDGNHEASGPLNDAIACERLATKDSLILFHDLASPDVSQGLDYLQQKGWKTMIYQTTQIMGVAWRGNVEPVKHQPDDKIQWPALPNHLKGYLVSGLSEYKLQNKSTETENKFAQSSLTANSFININCSNQTGLLTEYNRRIIELVDSNPGQLLKEEYSYITNIVINRKPSNFLVFGVGKDSKFWIEVNKNGETIFLEDSRDWLNQVKAYCPQIKAYLVEYGTTRKQWLDLLEQYRQGIDSLLMILPEKITQTKWDVIFVDAPAGYSDEVSGRMKSIYLAAKLALNSGNTDVFVHDCDRQVEKIYSSYFLKNENLVTQVKKLNHYKIINANLKMNDKKIKEVNFNNKKNHLIQSEQHLNLSSQDDFSKGIKILHIIQQLSLGGASRSMIATAKYSSLMNVPQQHRILTLLPAVPEAASLAKTEGMYVINQVNKETIWREIEAADIVHIHFWNNPEIYELLHSEIPAMRVVFWFKIIGDKPPHIITKQLLEYTDFSMVTSPYTMDLPVFENISSENKNSSLDMVYGIADFDRLRDFKPKPHDTFNVGYIGTVDFAKMHSNYVGMSAKVNIQNVKFIVCGGFNNYLQQEVEKLGLKELFDFRGYVENIRSVLEVLDVFGYPLCEDTYATSEKSLQEAMWAGVPPVVFPYGGVKKLVIHNQTGLIVHNEIEYKNAIEYLYFYPEERLRLSRNAREYARQNFHPEQGTKKINKIYTQLLKKPKRKHRWSIDKISGAELFIKSLGSTASHFSVSLTSENISELLAAENQIADSSPVLCNKHGGGIFNYRDYYSQDGYLRLWSGLVLQKQGQHHQAISEFTSAINLGCNNWRVGFYLATSAEKINRLDLAEKLLLQVIQKAPNFTPTTEILHKVLDKKEKLQLSTDSLEEQSKVKNLGDITANISTTLSESINTGQLDLQRQFWNVNSLDEAMFGRVFTDNKINAMSPQEKMEAWENSVLSSTQKLFIGIPIKAEWKVLEIGCGVGRLIKYLREKFAQVDGVDISENMIQFARQYLADGKQNGEVYVNNGYDLQQLPDQNYDFVYSTIVFQHIRSISIVKSYFQETLRVLKPGGYFRLQVHDYSASSLGNFDEEGAENQQYYFYGNAYTDTQLKDLLLVKTGFDLVSLESSKPWIWATVKRPEKQIFSPLVSAIVSTYNSEKFIRGCLEDLVHQTLYQKGKLEIIIIDSASVEKEGAIAHEFQSKYPHIIYQRTPERESIYAAWNRAIKIAKGNYITNANTDDRHRPDALEKMANYLNNNPDISLVYPDQLVTTFPNDSWATTQANKCWNWPEFDYQELERRCIIGSQPMWKKSLHQNYGYFSSKFKVAGDYEFWLRIGKKEKIAHFSEILGLYFENEQGLEKSSTKAVEETYNICCEYGIIQRGIQRKTSVAINISESELISLPFREIQNLNVKNKDSFSLSTNQSINSISDDFLIQSELVSVIVLCYNQAQYLTEAVESIVKQTYQNWECLIINDGSLDQTYQVAINLAKKYPEKNVRLIEKENTGVPDSRNVGIDSSSGKFILFVDADDKIHPNFITETLAVLQTNPQVGFVYTDIQKFGFEEKIESYGNFNVKRFLSENQAPVTSLFRREIYEQVGGFKKVMNEGWEDWEFWISAYQKDWLGYRLEKPYLYYRQHPIGSRQQKLHQNSVNLAVHKAIIIYLHSQLYNQQEVVWSEQILSKYKSSLITELDRLKSKLSTMTNLPVQYPQISPLSEVKNRPFWSVMIPTYNPTSTLEQTLKSVLQQAENINEMQIEVVDDCSTQVDVEPVVKKIGQGRISYYRQPQNLGLVTNWNNCIKRASGKWIHILHQDDLVLPGFYSSLKKLLEKQPEVGAAFCRYYYIDENENQKMISSLEKETPGIISNWLEKIVVMQRIQCASIVVKRRVYEQLGGFCLEANSAADWEMWKRIAAYYPVSYEPEILACYRLHSTSETSRLIKFGGNISDTRKAIEISESYLSAEISKKLSNQAREHYAISATKTAQQMLSVGKTEVA
ncbi:MAG: glycosyltransferase, partial [Trichodesmium sp. St5_bin8]|nr:glycosyltransferase [Trichodesmium sp. St5_bin8]